MKVLTLEELRLYLGMKAQDTEHDTLLASLEAEAFGALQVLTGLRLDTAAASVVEIVSGTGEDSLFVRNPVASITSVRYRFAVDWRDPWAFLTEDPTNDLEFEGRRIFWKTGSLWPLGEENIEITYAPTFAFPDALRGPLKELVAERFRGRPQATGGRAQPGAWRGLSPLSKAIINSYRRPGR